MVKHKSLSSVLVRFRFDGDKKSEIANLTYEQYSNLKELPITVECKIVTNQKPTLSKSDVKRLEKKLADAIAKSKSHTQRLAE
ncbi:hypothetical protein NsoK4_06505 [Nitrosopumilus sp. K4]|uniref:hypothetical protein n=1 Tax=Nitrosopumilus sp. K4 TaxID=2795383 RepID=UPI001BA75778|nr:hypothetical protein [Nitrosopumilus sp. K4]QUC64096.1 hypothetical protein NsoK4_06505 [Nitrosopumilus sp. K4]